MSKKAFLNQRFYYNATTNVLSQSNSPKVVYSDFTISEREILRVAEGLKLLKMGNSANRFLTLLPKGVFIRDGILQQADLLMRDYGAFKFRFPLIFEPDSDNEYLRNKFAGRIFPVGEGSSIKYASDPLVFSFLKDMSLNVPLKIYSPDYFYRNEQSGELATFTRPREFYMTDFHTFARFDDFKSIEEALNLNVKSMNFWLGKTFWELSIDVSLEFYQKHANWIRSILEEIGADACVNCVSTRSHYYDLQFQFIGHLAANLKTQFSNLQWDIVSPQIYHLCEKNTQANLGVIHGTLLGRVEKIIALLISKQLRCKRNDLLDPVFPTWLAPVSVRVVLLGSKNTILLDELVSQLQANSIRYQIDERDVKLAIKIKSAKDEWVPYIVVIGEKEVNDSVVSVRLPGLKDVVSMSVVELIKRMNDELKGFPKLQQPFPYHFFESDFF